MKALDIRRHGSLIGLLILTIIITSMNPNFLSTTNLLNVLLQVSVNALISFGMLFVILTGGIDLSVGAILALSSAITADLIVQGYPPFVAMGAGLVCGAVFGVVNGLVITKGKIQPFIATLATMTIFRGLTLVYTNGNPISGLSPEETVFSFVGKGDILSIPVPVIIFLIVFTILMFVLGKTTFGRYTYAIGGNEDATKLAGINVDRIKIMIYTLSGLLAALAGIILTSRLDSAQSTAGVGYELDAIAAVVLGGTSLAGGRGRITGTLIGILILGVINNGLNMLDVSSFYQNVVKGSVILLAILLDRKDK
ncbi:MAG: rbsC [Bacillales bacterium]|jgi:ribose transport system permease protein|nr:rbsC [Bacillales bacterium]